MKRFCPVSRPLRVGATVLALGSALVLGGCIVVVHDYDDDWGGPAYRVERPRIGVHLDRVSRSLGTQLGVDRDHATLITGVADHSPADEAGLERWDVVVAINGDERAGPGDLTRAIRRSDPGGVVSLSIMRGGQRLDIDVMPD